MEGLQHMLLQHHQYTPVFKHAYEILCDYDGPVEDAEVHLHVAPGLDKWRYNLPTADEVAVILPGAQFKTLHDIVLRNRVGPLYRISDLHPAYPHFNTRSSFLEGKMDGILTWSYMKALDNVKPGSNVPSSVENHKIDMA